MSHRRSVAPEAGGHVPVIDLSSRDTARGRAATASAIGRACERSGFFAVTGHGVPRDLIDRMYRVTSAFFALPDEEKDLVAHRPGVSGFRRAGGRTAHSLGHETPPDLCEVFSAHATGELDRSERERLGGEWATWTQANIWPRSPAGFKDVWLEYMTAAGELSADLMRLFALALGLDERFFDDRFRRHGSSIAANHYYARSGPPLPGQLRRGEHTDFGALTVLHQQDGRSGLQVRRPDGAWHGIPATPGGFVVNIGDLMSLWTGGRWRSALHRVVVPEEADRSSRLSVPFFYMPDHDVSTAPLPPFAARADGFAGRADGPDGGPDGGPDAGPAGGPGAGPDGRPAKDAPTVSDWVSDKMRKILT
ncbi:isopenicillin N synthase family dioxygenase [Streptomyces sp. NPDC014894]|uniref:isopenicillin N synthase family dioxygenase n=1 Tax=Streptomyces sp. NPDC014894 TaxID=3364931 RepID=UPI003700A48E